MLRRGHRPNLLLPVFLIISDTTSLLLLLLLLLGVQLKLWDPLRTRAVPERLRGVFATRHYTNPRLSLPLPYYFAVWSCIYVKRFQISTKMPANFIPESLCIRRNVGLFIPHSISSNPSGQSRFPSHLCLSSIQLPSRHVNW